MQGDTSSQEPRQARANVVPMPQPPQPGREAERKAAPPGQDHAEPHEEPGYGHGV